MVWKIIQVLFCDKKIESVTIDFLKEQDESSPATDMQKKAIVKFSLVPPHDLDKETASFIIHTLRYVHAVKKMLKHGSLKGKPYYHILRSFYQQPSLRKKMDEMNLRRWRSMSKDFRPRRNSEIFILTSSLIQFGLEAAEHSLPNNVVMDVRTFNKVNFEA